VLLVLSSFLVSSSWHRCTTVIWHRAPSPLEPPQNPIIFHRCKQFYYAAPCWNSQKSYTIPTLPQVLLWHPKFLFYSKHYHQVNIYGYLLPPCSEIIIINKSTLIYNLFTHTICDYTVFYCTHYHYILKSVNQIPLKPHSTSQISYLSNQVVYKLISPNSHL
jgi:hypothetical protein